MKRLFLTLLTSLMLLFPLAGCSGTNYSKYVSEVKSDVFTADCEEFSLTVACVSREYPYLSDGICAPRADLVEISLTSKIGNLEDFSVALTDLNVQGELSFRYAQGDYFLSQGVTAFPEGSVSVTVTWAETGKELYLTSVKGEHTISAQAALESAIESEKELVRSMDGKNGFTGEFRVRLLRRDRNYYYVGIVSADGKETALLVDGESGEILARRIAE